MRKIFSLFTILVLCGCLSRDNKKNISHDLPEIVKRANDYYLQDQYLKAEKCFDTLLQIDSSNIGYLYKRAYSKYMLINDDSGALKDFFKVIELSSTYLKSAYLTVGGIHRLAKNYDSAIYFYNKTLEIDPNYEKAKGLKKEVLELNEASKKVLR